MSVIEKLSIQGIRSFGSSIDDIQTLRFTSPVTLILGENGCGKTTIIECLKYALTGDCPPGSDRGKNFIHDPKIFSLMDTLGQIKLVVKNAENERLSVCRSMKLGMKRGKVSFETLDATVNYLNRKETDPKAGGDSISTRCADVDTVMCRFMGVSKAIINNVLFCHQEESNWPLDEAKKLKEKFDAIFGIAEYNKCVDRVIKLRKDKMTELKLKESDLRLLQHKKEELESKTVKLSKYKEEIGEIDDKYKSCQEQLTTLNQSLQDIMNNEDQINKLESENDKLQMQSDNYKEQMSTLRGKIIELIDKDCSYLEQEIITLAERTAIKRDEQQDVEKKLKTLMEDEANLNEKLTNLEKERILVKQQFEQYNACKEKYSNMVRSLCISLRILYTESTLNSSLGLEALSEDITAAITMEQMKINGFIKDTEDEDNSKQQQIDKIRGDLIKVQENMVNLNNQLVSCNKEYEENNDKLQELAATRVSLEQLGASIRRIEMVIEELNGKFPQDEIKNRISATKAQITSLEEQFNTIDQQLTYLNSINKLLAEIGLKEEEQNRRKLEITRLQRKHSSKLKLIFPRSEVVYDNLKYQLQQTNEKYEGKIQETNRKILEDEVKRQQLELKRTHCKEEIAKDRNDIEKFTEYIYNQCHNVPYEEALLKCQATVNSIQMELTTQQSADIFCKKFIQELNNNTLQPFCPLCHKDLHCNESLQLKSDLHEQIEHLPQTISRLQTQLKTEQDKYANLLQLKPIIDQKIDLELKLPSKEECAVKLENDVASICVDIEARKISMTEPIAIQKHIAEIMPDIIILEETVKEVIVLQTDINTLKAQVPVHINFSTSNISDLQIQKNTISANLSTLRGALDADVEVYERNTHSLNKMREQKDSLKDEEIKLRQNVLSIPQLEGRQQTLFTDLAKLRKGIGTLQTKEGPLKTKLEKAIEKKDRLKQANQAKLTLMQSKLNDIRQDDNERNKLQEDIAKYESLNIQEKLIEFSHKIKHCQKEIIEYRSNLIACNEDLDDIKNLISNHQSMERNLQDNVEFQILKGKLQEIEKSSEELRKDLEKYDVSNLKEKKSSLNEKKQELTEQVGELQGQRREINRHITQIETELAEKSCADIMMEYKCLNLQVILLHKTCSDLLNYRLALDNSLMHFHKEKMTEINRLIREYWRLIYCGNDIDYIEIQTDVEEADTSKKNTERRRSYTYHLVQSKNNSMIEMRGRCSAGQRVIASLIIRMALAETFSSNCGVLALDEPTTNLDRKNIISLCDALNRTVEERRTQSNFMLIIITHDEAFISSLGKIRNYIRVFRNTESKSVIRRVEVA